MPADSNSIPSLFFQLLQLRKPMSLPATHLLPNSTSPAVFLPTSHKLYKNPQQNFTLKPIFFRKASTLFSSSSHSLQFSTQNGSVEEDEDEPIIGDCLVFEEGIFDDPSLQERKGQSFNSRNNPKGKGKTSIEIEPENLIPEKWIEMQKEINITKKERRKLAQQLEFGRKVEKKREGLRPISSKNVRNVNVEEFGKYRDEKLKQLNPIVLDKPEFMKDGRVKNGDEEVKGSGQESSLSSSRVKPRNPRLAVYGAGLDDISAFLNSGNYDPNAAKKTKGPRKLFTKDEKLLLNRRIPDLAVATSGKWQPLHTLSASGEFHLISALLKHNIDINALDKDGLTAIHKAVLGKKQAIFNFLLRESSDPFVRDKEGATLMHYAVRTASSQMIKILLLYNVDINLQDDDGWTPLHLAVQSLSTDTVRLLLIKGADKTLRNKDGLTPLDLCLYSGRDTRTYELIKLLKQLPRSPST